MPTTSISTSDLGHCAWLLANGLAFERAESIDGARVVFSLADPDDRGKALLGELVVDEILRQYISNRGLMAAVIRLIREERRTLFTADEFARFRSNASRPRR